MTLQGKVKNSRLLIKKLLEVDKMKSDFYSRISHELRTPLMLILAPIESLFHSQNKNNIDKNYFVNIQRNAIKLLKLVNILLDFSKIEAGKMNVKVVNTDIVKFIRNYTANVGAAAESRKINLNFSSTEEELHIFFDREKMDKIFMNIVSNSLKFTEKGFVKISINIDKENCRLSFKDTGEGIPLNILNSIFERFSRVELGEEKRNGGTGIGLELTRELVELHGWSISVNSKFIDEFSEDHGTEFVLVIPIGKFHFSDRSDVEFVENVNLDESIVDHVEASFSHRFHGMREMHDLKQDDAKTPDIPIIDETKKHSVLVVDDNKDLRNFISHIINQEYNVYTAVNGSEGIKLGNSSIIAGTPDSAGPNTCIF